MFICYRPKASSEEPAATSLEDEAPLDVQGFDYGKYVLVSMMNMGHSAFALLCVKFYYFLLAHGCWASDGRNCVAENTLDTVNKNVIDFFWAPPLLASKFLP